MSLIVFPYMCLYFIVGYLFSKAVEKNTDDDFTSALWFMLWPVLICLFILMVLITIPIRIHRYFSKKVKGDA